MNFSIHTKIPKTAGFENVDKASREVLMEYGFGAITEIDVKGTLKKKIGVDFNKYTIIGACNPKKAHELLLIDPLMGLFLPCNLIIFEDGDDIVVAGMNSSTIFSVADNPKVHEFAKEVTQEFEEIIEKISKRFL